MFITTVFNSIQQYGNNPDALQMKNGSRNCGLSTQWLLVSHEE
jgi:hypothetical protein